MIFEHPWNGYTEKYSGLDAFLYTLFFGPLYFAVRGIWGHAILSILAAVFTFGLSWFVYPFIAPGIVKRTYLRGGWRVVV